MREHKASELAVTLGRLMWQIRQTEAKRERAMLKRPLTYKVTRRDHRRESLPRW